MEIFLDRSTRLCQYFEANEGLSRRTWCQSLSFLSVQQSHHDRYHSFHLERIPIKWRSSIWKEFQYNEEIQAALTLYNTYHHDHLSIESEATTPRQLQAPERPPILRTLTNRQTVPSSLKILTTILQLSMWRYTRITKLNVESLGPQLRKTSKLLSASTTITETW